MNLSTLRRLGALAIAASLTTFAFAEGDSDKPADKPADKKPAGEKPGGHRRGEKGKDARRGGGDPIMRALDTDKDQTLSSEELTNAPKALLALDRNKDGQITREELRPERRKDGAKPKDAPERDPSAEKPGKPESPKRGGKDKQGERREGGRRPRGSVLGRALDTNKDQTLSADEIRNATASLKTLDKNKDGKLTRDELRGARGMAGFMGRFDKDGDGKISKDEAPGRMAEQFDFIDTNGDGFLDSEELESMMKKFRRGGRGRGRGADRPNGEHPDGARPDGDRRGGRPDKKDHEADDK